ncbi:WD repeat-containing protein 5 homolog isoform X2 [Ambystoma mexicanum]
MKRSIPVEGPRHRDAVVSGDARERTQAATKQPKSILMVKEASTERRKETGDQTDPLLVQRRVWREARFLVHQLTGHADLITSVVFQGTTVVSASRDTTVKVWNLLTGLEEKNLAGHQGAVTCLTVITHAHEARIAAELGCDGQEQFVASGSTDSSIIIWALTRGGAVKNIYTFCGVSALSCLQESGLLVSGSEAGKVELWDPLTKENRQSESAHEDTVTALQEQAGYLFSGSKDGVVKVWQIRAGVQLRLVYASEITTARINSVRCLTASAAGDRLYFGNNGTNIKVLFWRTGKLHKLTNHLSDSGFVDAVHVTSDGLLISTGFNIDLGHGYLNVRTLNSERYLGTLPCPDAPRLLCLDVQISPSGLHRWVTGGRELLIWEQVASNSSDRSSLKMSYWSKFDSSAAESGSEDDDDFQSSEEEEDCGSQEKTRERQQEEGRSWLWCSLL